MRSTCIMYRMGASILRTYRILEHVAKEKDIPLRRSYTVGLGTNLPRVRLLQTGEWLDDELMVKLVQLETLSFQAHVYFMINLPWISEIEATWFNINEDLRKARDGQNPVHGWQPGQYMPPETTTVIFFWNPSNHWVLVEADKDGSVKIYKTKARRVIGSPLWIPSSSR